MPWPSARSAATKMCEKRKNGVILPQEAAEHAVDPDYINHNHNTVMDNTAFCKVLHILWHETSRSSIYSFRMAKQLVPKALNSITISNICCYFQHYCQYMDAYGKYVSSALVFGQYSGLLDMASTSGKLNMQ